MKPYGWKSTSKLEKRGDGCFLCTQHRKTSKKAVRKKAKEVIRKELEK